MAVTAAALGQYKFCPSDHVSKMCVSMDKLNNRLSGSTHSLRNEGNPDVTEFSAGSHCWHEMFNKQVLFFDTGTYTLVLFIFYLTKNVPLSISFKRESWPRQQQQHNPQTFQTKIK